MTVGFLFFSDFCGGIDYVANFCYTLNDNRIASAADVVGVKYNCSCACFVDLYIGVPIYGAAHIVTVGGIACGSFIFWRIKFCRRLIAKWC